MLEIVCKFIQNEDAHKANYLVLQAIKNTKPSNDILSATGVHVSEDLNATKTKKPIYEFRIYIRSNAEDTEIEKSIVINGGQLNIMNGKKHIWAFS